jgi:hypothetical protein
MDRRVDCRSEYGLMSDDSKRQLLLAFIEKLERDLVLLKAAAKATHEAATNEESKPENEYDTRALEASYLAGAQAKRVAEIQEVLTVFKNINLKPFAPDDPIQNSALVDIEVDGKPSRMFVLPLGGGESVEFGGKTVQIVTPGSALGKALLGMHAGDSNTFEVNGKVKEIEVMNVE